MNAMEAILTGHSARRRKPALPPKERNRAGD